MTLLPAEAQHGRTDARKNARTQNALNVMAMSTLPQRTREKETDRTGNKLLTFLIINHSSSMHLCSSDMH